MVAEQDVVSVVKTLIATVTATATVSYDCAEVFEHVAVPQVKDADPVAVGKAAGFDAVTSLERNCTIHQQMTCHWHCPTRQTCFHQVQKTKAGLRVRESALTTWQYPDSR